MTLKLWFGTLTLFALPFTVGCILATGLEWPPLFGGVWLTLAWVGAWIPAIIAYYRPHHNRFAITVLNLVALVTLFTFIGLLLWPLALIWALTGPRDVYVGVGVGVSQ
jgi:hypothetical protein